MSEELYGPDQGTRDGVQLEHEESGEGRQLQREEPAYESSAALRLAKGPLVGPVLCRVVSIVLARANCPMDRIDDAMLICDALGAHAPTHAADGHLSFAVSTRSGQFELRVGELAEQAASKLVGDAVLPGVGSVLERMTDELRIEPAADGAGEELVLGLFF
jgi:serine/threonine-protein kinase RsbW